MAETQVTNWLIYRRRVEELKKFQVHVGVLASQGGNERHEGSDLTLVEIASAHEFGSPAAHVRERSFIRSTFRVHAKDELAKVIRGLCQRVLEGKLTAEQAIGQLGVWAVAAIKKSITQKLIVQELAPETLRRKTVGGKVGDVALVNTAQLMNSITHQVIDTSRGGDE